MRPSELTEDLKAVPEDMRAVAHTADEKLQQAARERPALIWALDVRVALAAAAVALLVAFVLRMAGLAFVPALLLFGLLFAGVWAGITRAASRRGPTRPR